MNTNRRGAMHPYDLRLDIPFRAMANAQIIAAATSDGALKPYIRTTLRNLTVDPASYQLLDQAYVASLLYCLFVVPRHVLNLSSNDRLFANLNSLNPLQYFSISVEPKRLPEAPVFWLIQALRNSVAHALYEIDGQNNWRFWTEREPIWDARASRDSLMAFISSFGFQFVQQCLGRKKAYQ